MARPPAAPLCPTWKYQTTLARVTLGYAFSSWRLREAIGAPGPSWLDLHENRSKQTGASLSTIILAAGVLGIPANEAVEGRPDLGDAPADVIRFALERLAALCPGPRTKLFIDRRLRELVEAADRCVAA